MWTFWLCRRRHRRLNRQRHSAARIEFRSAHPYISHMVTALNILAIDRRTGCLAADVHSASE
jgi:hypothetical protein